MVISRMEINTVGLATILVGLFCSPQVQGITCRGEQTLEAMRRVNTLLSPGYPRPYGRNQECTWLLQKRKANANYTIQIAVLEMNIKATNGDCRNDRLEISSGDNLAQLQVRETWCGAGRNIFTTRHPFVRLRLVSDSHFGGRGFALEYGLIRQPNLQCSERPQRIRVESVPVYAAFTGPNHLSSCKWKIKSASRNTNLVFEVYKASQIKCKVGKFAFFEDEHDPALHSFEFCSNSKAFSKMYFASGGVTLVLNHTEEGAAMPVEEDDDLVVKMYQQPKGAICEEPIEVGDGPVMLSLPGVSTNPSEPHCRLRLQTRRADRALRLDVMASGDTPASCRDDLVDVTDDVTNAKVAPECGRGDQPVYRGDASMLVVDSRSYQTVFLRAASLDPECNGQFNRLTAFPDKVMTSSLPGGKGYINLSKCRALISAQDSTDHISLTLHWKRPSGTYTTPACSGDFVNVYNAGRYTNLVRSTCQESGDDVSMSMYSAGSQVMVELDADKAGEGQSVLMTYHSVPGSGRCAPSVKVNASVLEVHSSLYPAPPALNTNCATMLMAENENHTIFVNVSKNKLAKDCSSMLTIYEGRKKAVKRLCGKEFGMFTISGGSGMLVTKSGNSRGPGGWLVEVWTQDSGTGGVAAPASLSLLTLLVITFHQLVL